MRKYIFAGIVLLLITNLTFSQDKDTIPQLNKKIIEYCDMNMGKKVDRGECWDLAKFALEYAGAELPDTYVFGEEKNYKKDKIYPGDIIQMEKVKLEMDNGAWAMYPHHTAIVYEVLGKGKYVIVHQNSNGVRKVSTEEFDLNFMTKGEVTFFRPVSE